jgi:hypothetical protein
MPQVLTTASQAQCMHGGQALLITTNATLFAGGSPVLLETDIHLVVGCPFTVGVVYTPCITLQWESPSACLSVQGAAVLLETSIATCLSAAGAPQGIAIVSAIDPVLEAI